MSTDSIIPILFGITLILIAVIHLYLFLRERTEQFALWVQRSVYRFVLWCQVYAWKQEERRDERLKQRARVTPAPLFALNHYVVYNDDGSIASSETAPEPGSEAIEPTTEPVRTEASEPSEPREYDDIMGVDNLIVHLALVQYRGADGSIKQLSYEIIAKAAGKSKEYVAPMIRGARNAPEPVRVLPYSFDEKGRRIDR